MRRAPIAAIRTGWYRVATVTAPLFLASTLASTALAAPPAVSVLRLESSVEEQPRADEVTSVLIELLDAAQGVEMIDRTEVTMGDLTLVYGCELDDLTCLQTIAAEFGSDQVLYGTVEPFGDDLTVRLHVYDSAQQRVRPVYSRRIVGAQLQETLRNDLGDLLFGRLWELPAYLTLRVEGAVEGAVVAVGDTAYGQAPLERARVNTGTRTVRVIAPGYRPWEDTLEFSGGEATLLEVTLVPTAELATATPTTTTPASDGLEPPPGGTTPVAPPLAEDELVYSPPIGAWVALGVGGASLIAATATGVLALQAEDDYTNELRQRQADEVRARGESLALATNVLVGVGATGLLVSAAMFAFMGDHEPVRADEDDGVADFGAIATPHGAFLELRLGF